MSSEELIANLVGLMTSFHFEIKSLPDDLKCGKCKSVLKNACQMPCDCRFCRTCIDNVILSGDQFCPGGSQQCRVTPLSKVMLDYRANKSILKLTAKCPHAGCIHECPLADMGSHMRACSSNNIVCPFRELGYAQVALSGEEMSGHLLQESRSDDEILIGTIANISRDIEMLKRELLMKDEQGRHLENDMKVIIDENKLIKNENKLIKDDNKSIKDDNKLIKDENKLMKNENKLIKDENKSIRDQFNYIKRQVESIQMAVGLEQLDDWLIDADATKTGWGMGSPNKISDKFGHFLTFQLDTFNFAPNGQMMIVLRMWSGPKDALLKWPFKGTVSITITDRQGTSIRQTRQFQIKRPAVNPYRWCDPLIFLHAAWREAGLDLSRGMYISCEVVPLRASDAISSLMTLWPV